VLAEKSLAPQAEQSTPERRKLPIAGLAEFPLNAWYVGAFSHEVTDEAPFSRVICGKPVVFYRDTNGGPVALFDQCPHRGLPLSDGRLVGDGSIACGYHGVEFGADGACKRLTTAGKIPPAMKTQSFPLVEKWQWIWIWPGDPTLADPALIPDHDAMKLTAPGWYARADMVLHWQGNYLLQLENVSDALHLKYLHGDKVDDGRIGAAMPSVETDGVIVRTNAGVDNTPVVPLELWSGFDVDPDELVDRHALSETIAASVGRFENSIRRCKAPDAPRQIVAGNIAVTPETMTTHWAFYGNSTNFEPRVPDNDQLVTLLGILEEDRECMRRIQETIDLVGAEETDVSVAYDERTIRLRRVIADMLRAEGRDSG
jgi:phenylpropionate dioxygenase-like ring-hydroxylating dioxygenase large terminal subunit